MDNLNEFLNSKDCLNTRPDSQNSFQFDVNTDRSSVGNVQLRNASISNAKMGTAVIGTAQIGTMTFNEINGGTAILGGTSNGDGVLSVKNQAGSEVVKLDNTGMTVTNGSITIQNSSGSNVIDSRGLVSTNNFLFGNAQAGTSTTQSTTSTSFIDVNGGSLSVVLGRSANVLINYGGNFQRQGLGGDSSMVMRMTLNGTETGPQVIHYVYFGNIDDIGAMSHSSSWIAQLPIGTNTLKLQIRTDGGTCVLSGYSLNYLVLGV
jgi:hypothetical protein